jgi:hypothetical protein
MRIISANASLDSCVRLTDVEDVVGIDDRSREQRSCGELSELHGEEDKRGC